MNTKKTLGKRNEILAEAGLFILIKIVCSYVSPYAFMCSLKNVFKSKGFFVYIQVRNFCHDLEMFKTMFVGIL